jgi:hypothetical protein
MAAYSITASAREQMVLTRTFAVIKFVQTVVMDGWRNEHSPGSTPGRGARFMRISNQF